MRRQYDEPLFNLWHNNNLLLEEATFDEILTEMGERGLHKDNVDLEEIDRDTNAYNYESDNYEK